MSGDYSAHSFDPLRDFAAVLMQQGRPALDADWNELAQIVERRLRAETVDVIGRAVVPRETPDGFRIRPEAGPDGPTLQIGRGRMYVDGYLAENHGVIGEDNPPAFDRSRVTEGRRVGVLDELISREPGDFVDYFAQPYLPAPPELEDGGPFLVYLDVWQREVTPVEDPGLLEPALGGNDTTTRWQTVWQVRVLESPVDGLSCATADDEIEQWSALIAPSAARLTNRTVEFDDPDDPCLIPPGGGYRGLENQHYRVEIHRAPDDGAGGLQHSLADARFKWSREGASVVSAVEEFLGPDRVRVNRVGRDSVLSFRTGDWVEVTDDIRELHGWSGDMRQVTVDEDSRVLELDQPVSPDLVPSNAGADTAAARHSRMIRWDQSGRVQLEDGTEWVPDLGETSDGLIPVPPNGEGVVLEHGIVVSFSADPEGGSVRPRDHWTFAARTAGAQIETLVDAPPRGIQHHYARLAVVEFPETVQNCRIMWPPELEGGHDCSCSVCVTPQSHNGGELTIQGAIDQLPLDGGTVCLDAGTYLLGSTPVEIGRRNGVRVKGRGAATRLAYTGEGAAIRLSLVQGCAVEDLSVTVTPPEDGRLTSACVHLHHALRPALRRLFLSLPDTGPRPHPGIRLEGWLYGLEIEACDVVAPIGIASAGGMSGGADGYTALDQTRIEQTTVASRRAVDLSGSTMHLGPVLIARNDLTGGSGGGIHATGMGRAEARLTVDGNVIRTSSGGEGVVVGVSASIVQDNDITVAGEQVASGVRFEEGFLPSATLSSQVIGNNLRGGAAVRIDTDMAALLIKRNLIRNCASAAILTGEDAAVGTLAIDNNVIEEVLESPAPTGAVAAIHLSHVADAQVVSNVLAGVARNAANNRLVAGVIAHGVQGMLVHGNRIREVGRGEGGPPIYAVLVVEPFDLVEISDNRLSGSQEAVSGNWTGIAVAVQRENVPTVAALPAFLTAGDTRVAISSLRVREEGRAAGEAQLTIKGNQLTDAHVGSSLMVSIQPSIESSCVFEGNQCLLLVQGGSEPLVRIAAPRIVSSNNVVRSPSDTDSMWLFVGDDGQAAVLGNLTFGNIRLNNAELPQPFQPLNLLAP